MKSAKFIVFSNPVEGQEDEYNRWYTEEHLDEVLSLPGMTGATRYRLVPKDGDGWKHRYMAIYEINADDPLAVVNELVARRDREEIGLSSALSSDLETLLFEKIADPGRSAEAVRVAAKQAGGEND